MSDDFFAPSYWYGGGPDFSGLANAQAQYNQNQNYFGNQNATFGAVNSYNPWANTPGGFGAQTAAYAGLGAAYGRGTGGFGGFTGSSGGPESGPIGDPSVFETGAAPIPSLGGGGAPYGGGGFRGFGGRGAGLSPLASYGGGGYDAFDPSIYGGSTGFGVPGFGGRGFAGAQLSALPSPNPVEQGFNQFGFRGGQMDNQPAIDAVQAFNGVGTDQYPYQMPSFDRNRMAGALMGADGGGGSPFDQAHGAFPEGGSQFADRFAAGGYFQPGAPSQYATQSYTDVDGITRQPGQLPSGYQSLFGVDNPGGALPVGGFRGLAPRIMGDGGEDGLGSFDPTAFNPQQYAPGSPFGSGAGVGGRAGGRGGIGSGTGTIMPETAYPTPQLAAGGFGNLGSLQQGAQFGGSRSPGVLGQMPGFIGSAQDEYGNPFIEGNATPYALQAGRMGGGYGIGGLGQGTAFRRVLGQ
jgi:hypothetical protein